MRIFLTGAGGFVGSNLAHVFAERHGAEVLAPDHDTVDITDGGLLRRAVCATRPDAIVHAAIWNDPGALLTRRHRAWQAYVGATRNVVDAANAVDARVVLISTDWVFDGSRGPARESDRGGILHCCGGEHTDRVGLARRAADAFELDPELLAVGPAPPEVLPSGAPGAGAIPDDTRLDATVTAAGLGVTLPNLDTMLARLRHELEGAWAAA